MNHKVRGGIKRLTILMLAIVMMVGGMVVPSSAGILPITRSYIQATVDTTSWEIVAAVVSWEAGVGGNQAESKRIGDTILGELASSTVPSAVLNRISSTQQKEGGNTTSKLVLCFPGEMSFSGWGNNSTSADTNRAQLIRNSLIYDLNEAFNFVYGGDWQPSNGTATAQLQEYAEAMKNFLAAVPGGTINGASITQATQSDMNGTQYPDSVTNNTDYVKITKDGETRVFQYRMVKGYVDIRNAADGQATSKALGLAQLSSSSDASYIHWGTLAVEAFINLGSDESLQVTAADVYSGKEGAIERALADMLGGIAGWIANALGLWNFDEIIFNSGIRGTSSYVGGAFPSSWQPVIWAFFFISELGALAILLYAIIYNVGKKVMSTVDPVARASAIEQIKYLFIVALILGMLPFAIPVLINVSAELTGLFHDALGGKTAEQRFASLANTGGLGAILTYLLYLGALLYFNVFYVFRSLALALLIILAPIFVSLMAINENKRFLAVTWFKEFCATLFMQPLQAVMLSFILLVPVTGRRIESILMAYVMIPLTNMLRQVFFGGAGSMADMVGQKGRQDGKRTALTLGSMGLGAAAGAFSAYNASKEKKEDKKEGEGSENSSSSQSSTSRTSNATNTSRTAAGQQAGEGAAEGAAGEAKDGADKDGSDSAPESNAERVAPGSSVAAPSDVSSKAKEGMDEGGETVANANGSDGAGDKNTPMDASFKESNGVKPRPLAGAAAVAGAMALGAVGGALDQMNKRVFGMPPGRNGGIVTQLSRSMGAKGGQLARGKKPDEPGASNGEGPTGDASGAQTSVVNPMGQNFNRAAKFNDPNQDNVYSREQANRRQDGDMSRYNILPEKMKDAGIDGIHSSGEDESLVSYNMGNLSSSDQARMDEMVNMWENGTPEEKAAMQAAGISDITPIKQMRDGQEQTTGVDVTYNNELAKQNLGINPVPARTGGEGFEVSVGGDQAPAMVPDMANYMNTSQAAIGAANSAFSADKGSVTSAGDDMVRVYAPSEQAMSDMQSKMTDAQRNLISSNATPIDSGGVEAMVPQAEFAQAFAVPSSQATSQMRDQAAQTNVPFTQTEMVTTSQFQQAQGSDMVVFSATGDQVMQQRMSQMTPEQQAVIKEYATPMADGSIQAPIPQAEFQQAFPDQAVRQVVSMGGGSPVVPPPVQVSAPEGVPASPVSTPASTATPAPAAAPVSAPVAPSAPTAAPTSMAAPVSASGAAPSPAPAPVAPPAPAPQVSPMSTGTEIEMELAPAPASYELPVAPTPVQPQQPAPKQQPTVSPEPPRKNDEIGTGARFGAGMTEEEMDRFLQEEYYDDPTKDF